MTVKQWIKRLKKLKQHRLVSEGTFLRHLDVALRACASNRSLNMYKKEFPKEVDIISQDQAQMKVETERFIHINH